MDALTPCFKAHEFVLIRIGQSCALYSFLEFPPEMNAALQLELDISTLAVLEQEAVSEFFNPNPAKKWREGTEKCFFNYLLLDPRVTQNLPVRVKTIGKFFFVF